MSDKRHVEFDGFFSFIVSISLWMLALNSCSSRRDDAMKDMARALDRVATAIESRKP